MLNRDAVTNFMYRSYKMTNIFVGHVLSSPDTSDESILPCALVYVAINAMYIFKKYFTCLGSVYQRLSQISQRLIKPGSVCLLSHPSFLSSVFFVFLPGSLCLYSVILCFSRVFMLVVLVWLSV